MNNKRRKKIKTMIETLETIQTLANYNFIKSIKDEIEDILYEEQDAYDNIPENLQYSMRGEESSDAIDSLQEAVDALDEAINIFNELDDLKDEYNNTENEDEKIEKESEIELKEEDIDERILEAINNLEDII